MNSILIIIDSLRQDHVGAYGNDWILTPHLDAFAKESLIFTQCYPESLPTLPVRRALHTGKRAYPFHGHKEYKGDFNGAPGWGPIPEDQDTLAEILGQHDYRSVFITDTYHQFKPSKNFHRGFDEWIWIRGQEHDKYKSGPPVSDDFIAKHIKQAIDGKVSIADAGLLDFLRKYFMNNAYRMTEQDYYPAKVFREASRWLWDNQDAKNIFMVVDSFDPHEPWEPPVYYRQLYDPNDDCVDVIQSLYGPWKGKLTERELKRIQANYAGEVTMVDRWFGYFLESLRYTGRLEHSVVAIISDHGHNLGIDPGDKGLVSKQGHPMTRAVASLVLMMRHPEGQAKGTKSEVLLYNHDLPATLLSMVGIEPEQKMDGINFWQDATSNNLSLRDHVTIAWGPLVSVINDKYWYNASIWGEEPLLYAIEDDLNLEHNIADDNPSVCKDMIEFAIEDAGGKIPEAFNKFKGRPGCTPYLK
jgi:arylsulfatase A-like enzyme